MKTRIITGVIGIALLLGVFIWSCYWPLAFYIAVAIISAVSASEIVFATGFAKYKTIAVAAVAFSAFVPFSVLLSGATSFPVVQAVLFVYCVFLFTHTIFHHQGISFADLSVVFTTSLLVPFALSTMIYIWEIGQVHGLFYVVLILVGAWASDIGAYFIGSFFGKHKLAPDISPKKTVEGFAGGIAVCILAMVLVVAVYQRWLSPVEISVSYWAVALVAALCSVISVAGDLTFSMIKRCYKIKDFGNVFPGHGGMLDRFDSVVFVAPLVYLLVQFLPVMGAV